MKKMICGTLLCASIAILISSCGRPTDGSARWYSPEQVAEGKILFSTHCSGCHGESAQGDPNWKTALPDGTYPPPPLNGSAHAWHHPLSQLEATIANGGAPPESSMPGFANTLNHQQRLAVIAAFQDYWDNRTYKRWIGRGGRF
ncbi:MAG TPA: cytochrome c [Malonomonas sp.]